jgi:1-acyl-sn-glycerol-3-phosphate acyltransferase
LPRRGERRNIDAMMYTLLRLTLPLPFRFFWELKTFGKENVPQEGGYIVASNHCSHLDFFFFPCVVSHRMYYLAKKELFENPVWRLLMISTHQIPVDRGKSDREAFSTALEVLKRGNILGIFPEGTRSPDGELLKGHTGVARLSLMGHAPILPVGMRGTHDILPRSARVPRLGKKAEIHIGRIKTFEQYYGCEEDRAITRRITDDIMREIGRLAGKNYSH